MERGAKALLLTLCFTKIVMGSRGVREYSGAFECSTTGLKDGGELVVLAHSIRTLRHQPFETAETNFKHVNESYIHYG